MLNGIESCRYALDKSRIVNSYTFFSYICCIFNILDL